MSSFLIVCKKRKDKSKTRQKMLILQAPQRLRANRKRSEEPKKEATKGPEKRNNLRKANVSFAIRLDT